MRNRSNKKDTTLYINVIDRGKFGIRKKGNNCAINAYI